MMEQEWKDTEREAIEWTNRAFKRYMDSRSAINSQFYPNGTGQLTAESMDENDDAFADWISSINNMTRIANK